MMKDEFYFPSKDGNTEIHTIEWKPEGEVKAVVQLCHGMLDYVDRYDEFARFLCEKGFYVVGNDHLGHGKSVQCKSEYGYFSDRYGNACVLGDIDTLKQRIQRKYPGVPYFMLGQSMGSALVRQYMQTHGNELQGAILMGVTADQPELKMKTCKIFCRGFALVKGWHYRSRFIDKKALGPFNKKFKPALTHADWITSDEERLAEYVTDPLCTFVFTVNGYYNLMKCFQEVRKKENIFMIPKHLPILMLSGIDDPVGNFGKGVRRIFGMYKRAGLKDVTLQMYPDARHELLNETCRAQVYEDLYNWLLEKM